MSGQQPNFSNIILPLVVDSLSSSAPQRRMSVKSYQEPPPDPKAEAIKLIGLGLTCIAIAITLLNRSRIPPPP